MLVQGRPQSEIGKVPASLQSLARSGDLTQRIETEGKDKANVVLVAAVEEGSSLVNESGAALGKIVKSVKEASEIVARIATASAEQSSGIEEITKGVTQMDNMTQQNAALVEQASAAAASMGQQAGDLARMMSFFQLRNGKSPSDAVSESRNSRAA